MRKPRYGDSVFFNCPFDAQYMPLFRAVIFSIYQCGFFPRSALEEDNALDNRLDKIIRLSSGCKLGIHDISRTELNDQGFPRFNMPFELGLFFGAKKLGNDQQKTKNALIFHCFFVSKLFIGPQRRGHKSSQWRYSTGYSPGS